MNDLDEEYYSFLSVLQLLLGPHLDQCLIYGATGEILNHQLSSMRAQGDRTAPLTQFEQQHHWLVLALPLEQSRIAEALSDLHHGACLGFGLLVFLRGERFTEYSRYVWDVSIHPDTDGIAAFSSLRQGVLNLNEF